PRHHTGCAAGGASGQSAGGPLVHACAGVVGGDCIGDAQGACAGVGPRRVFKVVRRPMIAPDPKEQPMRMLTISLLALALAGPVLVAQETEDNAEANARALLGSMKQVRAELLGRHKMHMSMVGIPFGEARLAITRSAYGIDECYRVEFVALSRIDDLEMTNHSVAYVDAGMQLIWGSSNEVDGTRAKEEETIFRDGEKYTSFSPKDDGDELKKESFDARDNLIHDYTQPLL